MTTTNVFREIGWYPFKPRFKKGEVIKHYSITLEKFKKIPHKAFMKILDHEGFEHPVFLHQFELCGNIILDFQCNNWKGSHCECNNRRNNGEGLI